MDEKIRTVQIQRRVRKPNGQNFSRTIEMMRVPYKLYSDVEYYKKVTALAKAKYPGEELEFKICNPPGHRFIGWDDYLGLRQVTKISPKP